MKRKLAYLAVPLLLAALMLGVRWRAQHPAPTQEDLQMRALLATYPSMEALYVSGNAGVGAVQIQLTKQELRPFIECFYLSRQQHRKPSRMSAYGGVNLRFDAPGGARSGAWISISVDARRGAEFLSDPPRDLHPVTIQRWNELLLANPRVGAELRARL